jgi:hypothetical protein
MRRSTVLSLPFSITTLRILTVSITLKHNEFFYNGCGNLAIMLCAVILSVIMLNFIMLSVVLLMLMLGVIMLSIKMMSAIKLSVVS